MSSDHKVEITKALFSALNVVVIVQLNLFTPDAHPGQAEAKAICELTDKVTDFPCGATML